MRNPRPHSPTEMLTIVCGQTAFVRIPRSQLKGTSSPGVQSQEEGTLSAYQEHPLHFAWPSPSPFLAPAEQLRGNEVQASPIEKSGTCMQHFGLLWSCLRDWLLSHLTKSANKNGSTLCMAGYWQLRAKASCMAGYSTRDTAVPKKDTRGRKRLPAPEKRQGQTSSTGKLHTHTTTTTTPRELPPEKL